MHFIYIPNRLKFKTLNLQVFRLELNVNKQFLTNNVWNIKKFETLILMETKNNHMLAFNAQNVCFTSIFLVKFSIHPSSKTRFDFGELDFGLTRSAYGSLCVILWFARISSRVPGETPGCFRPCSRPRG